MLYEVITGIQLPIMVLNSEEATFDSLVRYKLEPEIYSILQLRQLIQYLSKDQEITVHLKLDTGMRRLGFEEKDLSVLCSLRSLLNKVIYIPVLNSYYIYLNARNNFV